jgi:hypothetical protein
MGKWIALIVVGTWFMPVMGSGQNLVWSDTLVMVSLLDPVDSGISLIRFRMTQDVEYSLSGTSLVFNNWHHGENRNLVSMLHHLHYRSLFTNHGNIKIINCFSHTLGIQYFFDSITRFQPDENTLDTRIESSIGKNLNFTFFSTLTTRMFNAYIYQTDQNGSLLKTLSASFLTPLIWTFSAGFGWTFTQLGTFSIGLSAGKFTWIRNRKVFDQQKTGIFYGIPKEKNHLFEYGFSLHLLVDKDFLNRVRWNCDLLVFKNAEKPFDLAVKNLIAIRINKYLQTSIQTRLFYEQQVSKSVQVENLLSLGFYVNL